MTALGADRDTLVRDVLELCVARLGEMIGEAPEIGETRPVGGAEFGDGPVVNVVREDQSFTIGLAVQAPDGADQGSVEGFAQAIADELISKGSEGPLAFSAGSAEELVSPEALATGFEVGDRLVGTVITFVSIEDVDGTATVDSAPEVDQAGDPTDAPTDDVDDDEVPGDVAVAPTSQVTTDQGTASVLAADAGEAAAAAGTVLDPSVGRSLGTLSQVELNVTVQLGSAELTIRDLMALSPGSVVRVGTQVGEPFPILVNGRVAAKGDLVVVNGRLGVRIRELISG